MTPELRYVWTDIETTGLDDRNDVILEIASIITDGDLNEIARYHSVIQDSPTVMTLLRQDAPPVVQEMHDKSGLWERCSKEGDRHDFEDVSDEFTTFLFVNSTTQAHYRLAGSSVHFDQKFLIRAFPAAMGLLTHRVLDVSTLMHFANENYGLPWFKKSGTHEAMTDIVESMNEYRYIRDALGVKP